MLMPLLFWWKYAGTRKTVFCLTTACRYFSDISRYEFGRCLSHVSHSQTAKNYKNEQIMSVSAQNFLALWTLVPRARAALFEYMPFVRVLENITFCSLFANPFHDFNHHSNQQQPPLPLLIGDMRTSRCRCFVLVMMSLLSPLGQF